MTKDKRNKELRERLLNFSVDILSFLNTLPYKKEYEVLRYQLSKSATSIGANYEESQNTTYKDFKHKVKIALREANETKYWINIIERLELGDKEKIKLLKDEARQISLILGSIASKVDRNKHENN